GERDGGGKRRTPSGRKTRQGGLRKKTGRDDHAAREARDRDSKNRHRPVTRKPLEITVHFLPYRPALENVTVQIKSGSVAYSIFALARLFLEKPERYDVRLTTKAESPLYRIGEDGAISVNREFL